MRYSSRFFLYAPFVLLLSLASIVMLHWWHASNQLAKRLDALNGHKIAPGVTLHFTSETIGGFPFRLDAMMDDLELDIATSFGPLTWRSEHFAAHMLTYGRSQQLFEAAGQQTLSWTDAEGAHHEFAFAPGSLRASAIAASGRLARFDLDLVGIASPEISGARFQVHFRKAPDADALDLALSGDELRLAPNLRAGFGDQIKRLEMEGRVAPAAPFAALLGGQGEWRAAIEGWRAHSGRFDMQNLAIKWGKLDATGSGQFSLSAAHRLAGLLSLGMTGLESLAPSNPGASSKPLVAALARLYVQQSTNNSDRLPANLAFENGQVLVSRNKGTFLAGSLDPLY
jgi:hypothetical protein